MSRHLSVVLLLIAFVLAGCAPAASAPANPTTAPTAASATNTPGATSLPPTPTSPAPMNATITATITATVAASETPISATSTSGTATAGQTVTISIKNYAFGDKNAPVTIRAGTTVVWRNDDNTTHTVTADDKAYNSGDLSAGATFSHTFTQSGDYPYYCIWHGGPGGQGMSAKIVVTR
jgi:plastocyanin